MKDYSKFIPTSYGFITDYKIVGNEIHVYTVETKQGKPHIYQLEQLHHIEKRFENQYKLIIENRDVIKDAKKQNIISKTYPLCGILTIVSLVTVVATAVINPSYWLALLFILFGVLPFTLVEVFISITLNQFDKEMDIIELFLKNRLGIEELSQEDKNITSQLSFSATKRLMQQKALKEEGTIKSAINVNFMNKTTLNDLKQLLTRYMISKNLLEEQKIFVPLEEEKNNKTKSKKNNK